MRARLNQSRRLGRLGLAYLALKARFNNLCEGTDLRARLANLNRAVSASSSRPSIPRALPYAVIDAAPFALNRFLVVVRNLRKLRSRSLLGPESQIQHRQCENDMEPGDGSIIRNHEERITVTGNKSPDRNDGIHNAEDFEKGP